MKLWIGIVLIFWMVMTLVLAVSIIGWFVLRREDHNCKSFQGEAGDSIWMTVGKNLQKELIA